MTDVRPGLDLPDGIPPWLAAFVLEAQRETDTLRDNGAEQAAAARVALLRKLLTAAAPSWTRKSISTRPPTRRASAKKPSAVPSATAASPTAAPTPRAVTASAAAT
jgi:hypothetical protein